MVASILIVWLALDIGFLLGAWWALRPDADLSTRQKPTYDVIWPNGGRN